MKIEQESNVFESVEFKSLREYFTITFLNQSDLSLS